MFKKSVLLLFLLAPFLIYVARVYAKDANHIYNWPEYMKLVEYYLVSRWMPPKNCTDESAYVTFTINRKGELISSKISETSGSKEFDEAVLKTVKRAAPFGPLPILYIGKTAEIDYSLHCKVRGVR